MDDLFFLQSFYPELKTTFNRNYSGTRFHIWKTKLDSLLSGIGISYVLTEPKPNPSDDRHDKWVDDDFKARHMILGTMDDNLYLTYFEHETAKSMMDALTRFFTTASVAKKLMYFKRYRDHRMKEGTSISDHVLKMDNMAMELKLLGVKLPEEMQAVTLMDSLPQSWEDVVTCISCSAKDEALFLNNVRNKLLNAGHWKDIKRRARDDEESSSSDGSGGEFSGNCYNCGEYGHRKYECPN